MSDDACPTACFAILGNAGSRKSTLARWLAKRIDAAILDLDTVAWLPGSDVQRRQEAESRKAVAAFCRARARWIVEGCYSSLIGEALLFMPKLIFLNPGEAQCLVHCRQRPWEAHKYDTPRAQEKHLPMLLNWVRAYYNREDELSLAAHRACFEGYRGSKVAFNSPLDLESPPQSLLDDMLRNDVAPESQSSSAKKLSA
jgi:adenylate kinase family enzyme